MVETWCSIVQVTQQSCTNEFHECWHTHTHTIIIYFSVYMMPVLISSSLHSFQSCLICKKKKIKICQYRYSNLFEEGSSTLTFLWKMFSLCQFLLGWLVGHWPVYSALGDVALLLVKGCASESIGVVAPCSPGPLLVAVPFHLTPRLDVHVVSHLQPLPAAMETSLHAHAYLNFELWRLHPYVAIRTSCNESCNVTLLLQDVASRREY